MFSLKPPPSGGCLERPSFIDLPEDILILIFSQCRIDELFALRLTASRAHKIISEYVPTIAPCVARSTFPRCELLLTPPSIYTFEWLKNLVPQALAAVLVDRNRFSHEWSERYGIPAEDPYGDELRGRIANGWRVLGQLSNISKHVYNLGAKDVLKSTKDLAWKAVHPSRYKYELVKQREDMILEKRLQYISSLSRDFARDYKLMFMLLSTAFRTSVDNHGDDHKPWIFDWSCGIDGARLLRQGNSWLTWFVLHEGPQLFWNQWCTLPADAPSTKNHIRDRSIEAWFGLAKITPEDFIRRFLPDKWSDVNEKEHALQRENAAKVQRAIQAQGATGSVVNPISYFTQYAVCRRLREETGFPPFAETLFHVPFNIDFRCPEEVFQKFRLLKEEKAVALATRVSARE
ncbi:hypothetical protein DM02DRAFT_180913 [Periconia macrospinosa]|uniref:F-box domain-containing protein n=1 Tax=Periconia macrospinosa TaxID=97972 RepID=A0A2V1D9Q7_9PLEO|nr:hypothetical protein DM02DRAFT_180913 [Periconia macrospinosa]